MLALPLVRTAGDGNDHGHGRGPNRAGVLLQHVEKSVAVSDVHDFQLLQADRHGVVVHHAEAGHEHDVEDHDQGNGELLGKNDVEQNAGHGQEAAD